MNMTMANRCYLGGGVVGSAAYEAIAPSDSEVAAISTILTAIDAVSVNTAG